MNILHDLLKEVQSEKVQFVLTGLMECSLSKMTGHMLQTEAAKKNLQRLICVKT